MSKKIHFWENKHRFFLPREGFRDTIIKFSVYTCKHDQTPLPPTPTRSTHFRVLLQCLFTLMQILADCLYSLMYADCLNTYKMDWFEHLFQYFKKVLHNYMEKCFGVSLRTFKILTKA